MASFENWALCLARPFFCSSLKNTAIGKEACQLDQVQESYLISLSKELLVVLLQNVLNISQSIIVFLTVTCDKFSITE